jgi:hypothetical protein
VQRAAGGGGGGGRRCSQAGGSAGVATLGRLGPSLPKTGQARVGWAGSGLDRPEALSSPNTGQARDWTGSGLDWLCGKGRATARHGLLQHGMLRRGQTTAPWRFHSALAAHSSGPSLAGPHTRRAAHPSGRTPHLPCPQPESVRPRRAAWCMRGRACACGTARRCGARRRAAAPPAAPPAAPLQMSAAWPRGCRRLRRHGARACVRACARRCARCVRVLRGGFPLRLKESVEAMAMAPCRLVHRILSSHPGYLAAQG